MTSWNVKEGKWSSSNSIVRKSSSTKYKRTNTQKIAFQAKQQIKNQIKTSEFSYSFISRKNTKINIIWNVQNMVNRMFMFVVYVCTFMYILGVTCTNRMYGFTINRNFKLLIQNRKWLYVI